MRIATTMPATVDAASVARIASMRSNDLVSMLYVLLSPIGIVGLQIPSAIQKSIDICNLGELPGDEVKSRGKSGAYQESPDRGGAPRDRQERLRARLGSR